MLWVYCTEDPLGVWRGHWRPGLYNEPGPSTASPGSFIDFPQTGLRRDLKSLKPLITTAPYARSAHEHERHLKRLSSTLSPRFPLAMRRGGLYIVAIVWRNRRPHDYTVCLLLNPSEHRCSVNFSHLS